MLSISNLDDFVKELFVVEGKIKNIIGKDLVLVIGKTGSGKSTLINYLMGNDLQEIQDQYSIIPRLELMDDTGPRLGHSVASETKYPEAWYVGDLMLIDTSGFGDTRGDTENLMSYFSLSLAIRYARKIRGIILVSELSSIEATKAEDFKELLSLAMELVDGKVDDANLILAVTKTEHRKLEPAQIIGTFESFVDGEGWDKFQSGHNLLKYFLSQTERIFQVDIHDGSKVATMLQPFEINSSLPVSDFKLVMDSGSRAKLLAAMNSVASGYLSTMANIDKERTSLQLIINDIAAKGQKKAIIELREKEHEKSRKRIIQIESIISELNEKISREKPVEIMYWRSGDFFKSGKWIGTGQYKDTDEKVRLTNGKASLEGEMKALKEQESGYALEGERAEIIKLQEELDKLVSDREVAKERVKTLEKTMDILVEDCKVVCRIARKIDFNLDSNSSTSQLIKHFERDVRKTDQRAEISITGGSSILPGADAANADLMAYPHSYPIYLAGMNALVAYGSSQHAVTTFGSTSIQALANGLPQMQINSEQLFSNLALTSVLWYSLKQTALRLTGVVNWFMQDGGLATDSIEQIIHEDIIIFEELIDKVRYHLKQLTSLIQQMENKAPLYDSKWMSWSLEARQEDFERVLSSGDKSPRNKLLVELTKDIEHLTKEIMEEISSLMSDRCRKEIFSGKMSPSCIAAFWQSDASMSENGIQSESMVEALPRATPSFTFSAV